MPDVRVLFVIGLSAAVITGFIHPARKRAARLGWRKLERVGVLAAIGLCGLILVLGPFDHAYQGEIGTTDSNGRLVMRTVTRSTLSVTGPKIFLILGVPCMIALLPVAYAWSARRRVAEVVAASLMTVFAYLGMLSIGMFYIPSMLALWIAAIAGHRNAGSSNSAATG